MQVGALTASLLLAAISAVAASRHSIYEGYTVYSVRVRDTAEARLLGEATAALAIDELQHAMPGKRDALLMVAPAQRKALLAKLDQLQLNYSQYIEDVARQLEKQDLELSQWRAQRTLSSRNTPFSDYPRYDEVNEYLEYLAATYPSEVTLLSAGTSSEGRELRYVQVSTSNFTDASKPVYFVDAMIHAREWVTAPVALHVLNRLLEERVDGEEDLLRDIDWLVMPLVNPDGYEYTHTDERLWRRTRSYDPTVNTTCLGVDANRNFDIMFNTVGVSANPCSQTYPGTVAFSEPETRAVRDLLLEHIDRIQVYLNLHSHGNYVLFGYGDGSLPASGAALHHVAAAMGAAIDAHKLPQAPHYLIGNSGLVLYPTSGSAQDYAAAVGVPFSYTLELPGLGYLFEVPPEYMEQINEETWQGVVASARLASLHYAARRAAANTL